MVLGVPGMEHAMSPPFSSPISPPSWMLQLQPHLRRSPLIIWSDRLQRIARKSYRWGYIPSPQEYTASHLQQVHSPLLHHISRTEEVP
jgi:hypothetical protein